MCASNRLDATASKAHCNWVIEQTKEVRALLDYGSKEMLRLNRTRALSAIETAISSLKELKTFIESVE